MKCSTKQTNSIKSIWRHKFNIWQNLSPSINTIYTISCEWPGFLKHPLLLTPNSCFPKDKTDKKTKNITPNIYKKCDSYKYPFIFLFVIRRKNPNTLPSSVLKLNWSGVVCTRQTNFLDATFLSSHLNVKKILGPIRKLGYNSLFI